MGGFLLTLRYVFGFLFAAYGVVELLIAVVKPWSMDWLNSFGKFETFAAYAVLGIVFIFIGRALWPRDGRPTSKREREG